MIVSNLKHSILSRHPKPARVGSFTEDVSHTMEKGEGTKIRDMNHIERHRYSFTVGYEVMFDPSLRNLAYDSKAVDTARNERAADAIKHHLYGDIVVDLVELEYDLHRWLPQEHEAYIRIKDIINRIAEK